MKKPPTLKQITRERWLRGRLAYKFHDGQKRLNDKYNSSHHQLFVNECARQFGKSYFWVTKALEKAFSCPNAKVKYGTAFYSDLIEFIIPSFEAVLEDCPDHLRPRWLAHRSKWMFPNGSEIQLVGLDRRPNGLRGNVIDLIILDEAGFIDKLDYLYKSVIIPATTHRPSCRVVLSSTPPSTPDHPFLEYVEKAEFEGAYILMTIYDNPRVDESTILRLMKESGGSQSTTWRREYLCAHVTDEDLAIIPEWNQAFVQAVDRDVYYPFYHKYSSMDLGIKHDLTAALFGYYDFLKATLVIEDEFVMTGPTVTTPLLQRAIKEKELNLWRNWQTINGHVDLQEVRSKNHFRYADTNNPLLLQDLSTLHAVHFTPTHKGSLEEMINAVRIMAMNGQIKVHPRCKQLAGCLKNGIWDKHRKSFGRSKVYGHYDALAALVYLVINLDKVSNPIPADFQVSLSNQILFQRERTSQAASAMRNAFSKR